MYKDGFSLYNILKVVAFVLSHEDQHDDRASETKNSICTMIEHCTKNTIQSKERIDQGYKETIGKKRNRVDA